MFYTVYKITNLINSKIYVGVHKTDNLDDGYMGSGKHLKYAQDKYGIENFVKEYLSIFDNSEDMFNMESEIVNEEFILSEETYNLKVGGFGGFDYINNLGLNYLHNNRENSLKNLNKGNAAFLLKLTDEVFYNEWKIKISESLKKLYENIDGTFKGKTHTDETKKLIGEKNSIHQKGDKNSQFGTMWIHNLVLKESKKIKKDEFPEYESLGWLKGRKMKF